MAEYYQGKFQPQNPKKYIGDIGNIVYRSSWELRVMMWLDENPDIERWGSEELTIPYRSPVDNQLHRYFPDFIVKYKTPTGHSVALMEVKPLRQTIQPIDTKRKRRQTLINEVKEYAVNQAKWKAAREFCDFKGWKFLLLTEKDIPGLHHK